MLTMQHRPLEDFLDIIIMNSNVPVSVITTFLMCSVQLFKKQLNKNPKNKCWKKNLEKNLYDFSIRNFELCK